MAAPRRHLFVDDFHVDRMCHVTRTMNALEKHPANPVLSPQRPWESAGIWAGNSLIWDGAARRFKLWYHAGPDTCLATSADGLSWERPILGLRERDGSTANNLIQGDVFQVLEGADDFGEPAAGQRYRSMSWSHEKGTFVVSSPDGLRWSDGPSVVIWGVGDTFRMVKSTRPLTGDGPLPCHPSGPDLPRYLGVARWCMPVGRFDGSRDIRPTRRVQALVTSRDLVTWQDETRILTPDALDDEMAHARIEAALADGSLVHDAYSDRRCEFYNMLIVPYEDLYLGLLLVFDAAYEFHRVGSNNQAGPGHMQLVASRDLLTWQRLGDRQPFLPRGAAGQFDWGLAWYMSLPVVKDGKLWFLYTGTVVTHGGGRDKAYMAALQERITRWKLAGTHAIGLATLRRDGWVSLDGADVPGTVLTRTFRWPERHDLHLNVDARGGSAHVAVCQPDGTPYPGYERSATLTADLLEGRVAFGGGAGAAESAGPRHTHGTEAETGQAAASPRPRHEQLGPGMPARLRFTIRNAKLYSYWFA